MRSFQLIVPALLALAISLPSQVSAAAPHANTSHAIATRICDVLHALPAQRKKECCHASATNLAELCTQQLAAALERKHTSVDASRIDACAAATDESLQGCDWVGPLQPALPKTCVGVIEGSAGAGTRCHSSLECEDGLYCRGLSPLAPGVCAMPAQPGMRCELPADHLASYTRSTDDPRHQSCNGLCIRGQCLAQVAAGGQCHASSVCANGLSCIDQQCRAAPLPQLGEACSTTSGCSDNARCIADTCTAPKAGGESCRQPFECRSFQCSIQPGATAGQCADVCAVLGGATQSTIFPALSAGAPVISSTSTPELSTSISTR